MAPGAKRILVVDDEPDVREFVSLVLGEKGYDVVCATDGGEALVRIEGDRPDLIVLDLAMPGLGGWEVLQRLKEIPDPPAVVILSAYPDEWRALRAGAWECLAKPFEPSQLVATCARALTV
jgi:CheY-like chemotaxis protein